MALFRIAAAAGLLFAVAPEPTIHVVRTMFGMAETLPIPKTAAADAAFAYCRENPQACLEVARKAEAFPATLPKGSKP
jgi:hypothetical protein